MKNIKFTHAIEILINGHVWCQQLISTMFWRLHQQSDERPQGDHMDVGISDMSTLASMCVDGVIVTDALLGEAIQSGNGCRFRHILSNLCRSGRNMICRHCGLASTDSLIKPPTIRSYLTIGTALQAVLTTSCVRRKLLQSSCSVVYTTLRRRDMQLPNQYKIASCLTANWTYILSRTYQRVE